MHCNHRVEPATAFVTLALLLTGNAGAQDSPEPPETTPDATAEETVGEAPKLDFLDSLKHIDLSDDGEIWLSIGGSMRVRGEFWSNFGFLPSSSGDDEFLLWRALLHADLHVGPNLRAFVQGKSALSTDRALPGGRRALDVDTLALQQGYVDVRLPFEGETSLTLRAGRQAYAFGRQRLVSPLPWANTMRAWDGATAILECDGWTVTGFWSQFAPVQKYDFNDPDAQQQLYGAYATAGTGVIGEDWGVKGIDLYFLGLANRDVRSVNGTTGTEDRYTVGSRIWGDIGDTAFDYDVEGAYQFGRVGTGDVTAFMVGAQLGYTFADSAWAPRIYAGVDVGSGDDDVGGDVETFNQLFPLGHAYYGQIDAVGRQNAIDLSLGATCAPLDDLTLALSGHVFRRDSASDALYNAGGGVLRTAGAGRSRDVGQEIDVKATYRINDRTTAELGYSHFFAGDFIEQSGPSNDIDFLYLQLRYVF